MKDIRIKFAGVSGSHLVLEEAVEDKRYTEQQCLLNIGTHLGSDPLDASRGTELLSTALSGAYVDPVYAQHMGNFAAQRTLMYLVNFYDEPANWRLADMDLNTILYDAYASKLTYSAEITFMDGTVTRTVTFNNISND